MDMRYLRYMKPSEKYYIPIPGDSKNDSLQVQQLSKEWFRGSDDHWTFCLNMESKLPEQGWKIHVTSNLQDAQRTLDNLTPYLIDNKISFKYVSNLWELLFKNSKYGHRGSSGKFITIYPKSEEQFLILLDQLSQRLKDIPKGPYILNDKRWKDSNVFFRYGGFGATYITKGGGEILAIKTPEGELIEDERKPCYDVPDFVQVPEAVKAMEAEQVSSDSETSPLDDYTIKSCLHFSNGGGVYLAEHTKTGQEVILKEGRPGAGLDGQKRDAIQRIHQEAKMLKELKGLDNVVQYIDMFQAWEHVFLVEEYIDGISLQDWMPQKYPFADNENREEYCGKVVIALLSLKKAVKEIHGRGLGMGDLQPANVILKKDGQVKVIDFEAASSLHDKQQSGLMTPGFVSPIAKTREQADWYALLRIARNLFLPISPVQDLSDDIIQKHDYWIEKTYGMDAIDIIREIEEECVNYVDLKSAKTIFTTKSLYHGIEHIPFIIEKLQNGLINDMTDEKQLVPGDIRQYEMKGGMLNVLNGGFGSILSLIRTGRCPDKAVKWAIQYSEESHISELDYGLFTGSAGIAAVLYEIGMKERALEIFTSIPNKIETEDVTLLSGLSGTGLALLSASYLPGFEGLLEKSITIAHQLEGLVNDNITIKPKDFDFVPIGFIGGWAGVSFFYSCLYKVTKTEKWLKLALETLQRDLDQCLIDNNGIFQLKENVRYLPYIAGGSAGVGLAMLELLPFVEKDCWKKEFEGIKKLSKMSCFYNVGLFRGMASMIVSANFMKQKFCQEENDHLAHMIELTNLYMVEKDDAYYVPGDFGYRISGDLFSGSAGLLLALKDVGEKGWYSWMPLTNVNQLDFLEGNRK